MFKDHRAPAPDPILGVMQAFAEDMRDGKIDLGVGVYRTADGRTPVMQAVKAAERALLESQETKGYVALSGDPAFHAAMRDLVLGGVVPSDRVAALATPGGTGAVRQAFELVRRVRPEAIVWTPSPTWPNHLAILDGLGMKRRSYRHYDAETGGLDREGMRADLAEVAAGDLVLLHGCCHNPTGADLAPDDWRDIALLLAERGAVPMVDLAYLGFGDGLEQDAAGLRLMAGALPEMLIAISGSKNFGLYRERVGLVLALCDGPGAAAAVRGTLAWLNRQSYAFPPDHGARVVTTILTDPALRALWEEELTGMRERIDGMRRGLADALREASGSDRFGHLAGHRGMFSLLPATPEQVETLRREHALYMIGDGRINVAGLTPETLAPAARAIATVLR
ncbi:aromatic amino acid transaminase [Tropicimonas sediminicola]|uniref:Aromatic amino acid aminotransferase apoenzyme n=1 Tax=Tropicimonas sediminicola TaxID=1031541 RepID=A0A239ISN9_9RHOB|nr:amino acid aminotransferase [Tropicimonas sediminicola]SNS95434.1 aromatic amino acid aminotransferase apoenzyme [Tropicimonas sediminicola]